MDVKFAVWTLNVGLEINPAGQSGFYPLPRIVVEIYLHSFSS